MGISDIAMEEEAKGFYSVGNKFVCSKCISEPDIDKFIKKNGNTSECSYCGGKRSKVVHFDVLIRFMLSCISSEYGEPNDEGLFWDKGWVGEVFGIHDLLWELGVSIENDGLRSDILDSLSDGQWCQRDFCHLNPSSALSSGWREFVNVVKHKSRYVFYRLEDESDYRAYEEIPPNVFLYALCDVISTLKLYKTLPIDTGIIRVRIHDKKKEIVNVSELAPPPEQYAIYPNRMSPSGIPMFYGAFDRKTAIGETYSIKKNDQVATVGTFCVLKPLNLIDFSKLPKPVGIFSECSRKERHGISFIREFLTDFTAPVKKDGREHIDYVPTQIISEHFRYIHNNPDGKKIDGIIYPSSKLRGKKAIVLFCQNNNCVEEAKDDAHSILLLKKITRVNPNKYVLV